MEKQAKKVLIAITKSNFGGAQKYVYILSKTLKNKGFLVKVLLGGDGILAEKLKNEGIDTIEIKSLQRDFSLLKEIKVFFEILRILRAEKPNVFHLNSSKIGAIGAFAGRLAGIKKIIFTAHGFAFNEDRGWLSKFIIKVIYWKTFWFSHKTIFVSEETKRQAPKFFLPDSKFVVIYNAIEKIDFLPKQEAKEILSHKNPLLDPNKKWVGSLAELHHIKRINLLIKSAKEILKNRNDIQFVVFGEGEERKNLEKKIQKGKIEESFILFGQLESASKYLKALDLFVLPSKSEAMPLSILEAMHAQIPIVASRVGGIPEMIYEDFIFSGDDLTEKILGKLGLEVNHDTEKFSLDKLTEKTLKIYEC